MIEWREDLSFGIEKVDNQHKEFINRLNQFLLSLKKGESDEEFLKVFKFLEEYAIFHFKDEEKFMEGIAFEELKNHKKLHEDFRLKLEELEKDLKSGVTLSLKLKIGNFLTSWLINNIYKVDKKYALVFNKFRNSKS